MFFVLEHELSAIVKTSLIFNLMLRANGRNIVGQQLLTLMFHAASVSTACCMLLEVAARSLKPVKMLAMCKPGRNNSMLGVVSQQCCVRLQGALIISAYFLE